MAPGAAGTPDAAYRDPAPSRVTERHPASPRPATQRAANSAATPCVDRCGDCAACVAAGARFEQARRQIEACLYRVDEYTRSGSDEERRELDALDEAVVELRRSVAVAREWDLSTTRADDLAWFLAQPEPVLCDECRHAEAGIGGLCGECSERLGPWSIAQAKRGPSSAIASWVSVEDGPEFDLLADALRCVAGCHPGTYRVIGCRGTSNPAWEGCPEDAERRIEVGT